MSGVPRRGNIEGQVAKGSTQEGKVPMTEKMKKPPVWAYADEWDDWSDVDRAVRLSYLCGVQDGIEGRVPRTCPLPPQVGDIVQYDSASWQWGYVLENEGNKVLIRRYNIPGTVEPSDRWHDIAKVVQVVSRRGIERRRT